MKTQLEEEVRTVIETIYNAKYVGTLQIVPILNGDVQLGYKLRLGMNKDERPIYIAFEGDKDGFIKYLQQELRIRRLSETEFYYGEKLYRNNEECCQ